jgi:hypothetical protein
MAGCSLNESEVVMTAGNALIYQGVTIRDDGELLSLTDMWRAAGSPLPRTIPST